MARRTALLHAAACGVTAALLAAGSLAAQTIPPLTGDDVVSVRVRFGITDTATAVVGRLGRGHWRRGAGRPQLERASVGVGPGQQLDDGNAGGHELPAARVPMGRPAGHRDLPLPPRRGRRRGGPVGHGARLHDSAGRLRPAAGGPRRRRRTLLSRRSGARGSRRAGRAAVVAGPRDRLRDDGERRRRRGVGRLDGLPGRWRLDHGAALRRLDVAGGDPGDRRAGRPPDAEDRARRHGPPLGGLVRAEGRQLRPLRPHPGERRLVGNRAADLGAPGRHRARAGRRLGRRPVARVAGLPRRPLRHPRASPRRLALVGRGDRLDLARQRLDAGGRRLRQR